MAAHPMLTTSLRAWRLLLAIGLGAGSAAATAQAGSSRGELLYRTHCIGCHTTQMHWRDARRATDWPTLVEQVSHWQARNNLGWGRDDIDEVARWLNATIYGFPRAEPRAQATPMPVRQEAGS